AHLACEDAIESLRWPSSPWVHPCHLRAVKVTSGKWQAKARNRVLELCSSLFTLHSSLWVRGPFHQAISPGKYGINPFFPEAWQEDGYFTSTVAPASVNFFRMLSASSLGTPSLIGLGAPSTKSLASFSPRLVTSRTALITLILLAPMAVRTTENSVCSSTGAAAAAAAPAPATATGAAAAADTPNTSSSRFTSSAASSSVN